MSRLLLLSAASLLAASLATAALAQNASVTASGTAVNGGPEKSAAPAPQRSAPPPSRTPQNSEQFVGPNASGCPVAGAVTGKSAATGPGPHCPPYEGSSSLGGNGTADTAHSRPADTGR